jgi:hypothetical protein
VSSVQLASANVRSAPPTAGKNHAVVDIGIGGWSFGHGRRNRVTCVSIHRIRR